MGIRVTGRRKRIKKIEKEYEIYYWGSNNPKFVAVEENTFSDFIAAQNMTLLAKHCCTEANIEEIIDLLEITFQLGEIVGFGKKLS